MIKNSNLRFKVRPWTHRVTRAKYHSKHKNTQCLKATKEEVNFPNAAY